MSDPAAVRLRVWGILAEELAAVTPAMIEAGSKAAQDVTVMRDGRRGLVLRMHTEAELMAAIWRAMLAAKLGGP